MKKAIYVEGETELVFVYYMILTHYQYQGQLFQIHCIHLNNKAHIRIPKDFGNDDAPDYFLIVCVGNDNAVLSALKDRAEKQVSEGFNLIIGLKDVFGNSYTSISGHLLNGAVVSNLISTQQNQLIDLKKCVLCFAIMEVEAWILGMSDYLLREYPGIILPKDIDPQESFVHPYNVLRDALETVNISFNKHWGDVIQVMEKMRKEDYDGLYSSPVCRSFNEFFDMVFGGKYGQKEDG